MGGQAPLMPRMKHFGTVSRDSYRVRAVSSFLRRFAALIVAVSHSLPRHFDSPPENKKGAMNAAAAKALDCFSLRECHGTEAAPGRRCRDAPYPSGGDAPALPTPPAGTGLPTALIRAEDSSSETDIS